MFRYKVLPALVPAEPMCIRTSPRVFHAGRSGPAVHVRREDTVQEPPHGAGVRAGFVPCPCLGIEREQA